MKRRIQKPKVDIYIEKFYQLNRGLYKRLHKYAVYQLIKKHFRSRSKVLVKKLKCNPLLKAQKKEIKDYYASFGFKNLNTEWHRFYTHVSGKFYKEYIPVGFFINVIEPHLNMGKTRDVLTDKNLLGKLFQNIEQPETIVKNINGYFLDGDGKDILTLDQVVKKCKKYSKLIIKPSIDSGGGRNISVINIKGNQAENKIMSLEEIIQSYNENFIIQKYFVQHKQLSKLNSTSVNTLRIISLLINDKVEIILSHIRIGGKDSVIDNGTSGGVGCSINSEGLFSEMGFNGNGETFLKTDTNVLLKGNRIPNFDNVLRRIKELHLQVPYFRMISWDIAIDLNAEPVLLEFNLTAQGIHLQFADGPLFGEFTDDILNECEVKMFN